MVKQLDAEAAKASLEDTFGPGGDGDDGTNGATAKSKPGRKAKPGPTVHDLGHMGGMPVVSMGIKMTKAGDGLSTALDIEPIEHDIDEEFYVLSRVRCRKYEHEKVPKFEALRKVEVTDVVVSTIVDDDFAANAIEEQERRNAKHLEERAGVQRIPGTEDT